MFNVNWYLLNGQGELTTYFLTGLLCVQPYPFITYSEHLNENQLGLNKSCIRETLNLLAFVYSSTNAKRVTMIEKG